MEAKATEPRTTETIAFFIIHILFKLLLNHARSVPLVIMHVILRSFKRYRGVSLSLMRKPLRNSSLR